MLGLIFEHTLPSYSLRQASQSDPELADMVGFYGQLTLSSSSSTGLADPPSIDKVLSPKSGTESFLTTELSPWPASTFWVFFIFCFFLRQASLIQVE